MRSVASPASPQSDHHVVHDHHLAVPTCSPRDCFRSRALSLVLRHLWGCGWELLCLFRRLFRLVRLLRLDERCQELSDGLKRFILFRTLFLQLPGIPNGLLSEPLKMSL